MGVIGGGSCGDLQSRPEVPWSSCRRCRRENPPEARRNREHPLAVHAVEVHPVRGLPTPPFTMRTTEASTLHGLALLKNIIHHLITLVKKSCQYVLRMRN